MKKERRLPTFKFLTLLILSTLFVGCAQYGMISENDVYLQQPNKINIGEDENDMTSYNAYKARQRGVFVERYNNVQQRNLGARNLLRQSVFFGNSPFYANNFYGRNGFSPYYNSAFNMCYDPFNPFGCNNFDNWGYYNNFGYGGMHGFNNGFYNGMNNGFFGGFHHGYNPYVSNIFITHNYYGTNINGGSFGNNNTVTNNRTYYGPRTSLSANSGRSSSYPSTIKSKNLSNNSSSHSSTASDQASSRRTKGHKRSIRSPHMPFADNSNRRNTSPTSEVALNNNRQIRNNGVSRASQSASNRRSATYRPSSTARNSGTARSSRPSTTRNSSASSSTRRSSSSSSYSRPSNSTSRSVSYPSSSRSRSAAPSPSRSRSVSGGSSSSRSGGSSSSGSSSRRR